MIEEIKLKYKSINIRGTIYKTLLTKKFENRKNWEKKNEKKIISFIPGTAIKIYVKDGQKVKEGEEMLSFEAMKMLNMIHVPFDGTIKKVHINEGDKFPKGKLLIEYI